MSRESFQSTTIVRSVASLAVAAVLTYGLYLIFQPFFISIVIAGITAVISQPLYIRLRKSIAFSPLAAVITIISVLLVIVVPLLLLGVVLFHEVSTVTTTIRSSTYSLESLNHTITNFTAHFGLPTIHINVKTYLLRGLELLGNRSTSLLGGALGAAVSALISVIGSFYILQNYETIRSSIIDFSPLPAPDTRLIGRRAKEVIQATVIGNLVLIAVQATAMTLGFFVFGIASPVLLGVIYGIATLVPTLGASLIWIPVATIAILEGHTKSGIGIATWAIIQSTFFDNILGPRLIQERANLHPFYVLLGVLGGVAEFGFIGIILGPTIVALGIVGLEILHRSWQDLPE